MKRFLTLAFFVFAGTAGAFACTNFIITRGASTDGSVMVSYSADSHQLYGCLYKYNAPGRHRFGETVRIHEWDSGRYLGDIMQADRTYSTVGNMNEHQLAIGETTFGGRRELIDPTGGIDYGSLIYITLQRAKTAREAIHIIAELANEYSYASSGESFSIADPNEAWIMELIGKGYREAPQGGNVFKGIVWVARRIPDGYICAHANQARIAEFPLNDPENCLYSPDVIDFARQRGYYAGPDENFRFCDAYAPLDFSAMRGCEARVWSFFNMFAPDMDRYIDYAMGHNKNNPMPLWVKPSRKISPKEVFDAMRDHYEGTPMDMTTDIGAGGEELPYRWRPMSFEVDGVEYVNERAIATQQTGFWFVSQSRNWLPDPVGGILWFGVDDAATSSLTPIYCSVTDVPECFREGNGHILEYSETAAFWIYNRVAQFAYLRYNVVGRAVREAVDEWEYEILGEVEKIDRVASRYRSVAKQKKYLTDYSVYTAQRMFDRWVDLDKYLMVKYIDGNVKKEGPGGFIDNGHSPVIPASPDQPGYTEKWKRAVAEDAGETLRVHDV
ncbi:MAG: C69 family dipeptidase [Rikenellaceae bacterium]|nr:C69 family dipeptidase [Rikenellaceae bacterium]